MSGASPLSSTSRSSSWLSRFKKRVSSSVSPSSSASSRKQLCSPGDNVGRDHRVDSADLPPAFVSQGPPRLPYHERQPFTVQGPSMFGGAHNFTVKDSTFIESNTTTGNFMRELLQETIIGAEFDSSARDPPPRCHPGTRLAIIQRCLDFINQSNDEGKLRWVVGPAGVGKSAVMQMVTETVPDDIVFASIFLSVNGRRDGTKTILTIAYQLAVKCGPYHQFIRDQINRDPSLLRKTLLVQFRKFIVEPFILKHIFDPSRRFLVVIDGLDECDNRSTQRELLKLITDFCIAHPTSPIAWILASRPEPHITSFFDNPEVRQAYTKEEMEIDSDEACEEVQRYLRDELEQIQLQYPTLRRKREWPLEHEFTKIASSAGGLFAYAATVIRYIDESTHGGPAAQLRRVLETIDASAKDHVAGRDNPMDRLDALYKRILSNVPDNVMINTRKLLLMSSRDFSEGIGFRALCNALRLTEDDAYDAVSHLHAVMKVPEPDAADGGRLYYYHKSFEDFLFDFERSGFSQDFFDEGIRLCSEIALRIVKAVPYYADGVTIGDVSANSGGYKTDHYDNVSLSWPGDERSRITDEELRGALYINTVDWLTGNFECLHESISCFHTLTTYFTAPPNYFPVYKLRKCAFDRFRLELTKLGKMTQAPLRTFDYAAVCGSIELLFTSPTGSDIEVSDRWNSSCEHEKAELASLEQRRGWSTDFRRYYRVHLGTEEDEETTVPRFHISTRQETHEAWYQLDLPWDHATVACIHCSRRFARYFMGNPDLLATVFVDSTQMCYVEVSFVDPDDGVSEWKYRFLHSGPPTTIDM